MFDVVVATTYTMHSYIQQSVVSTVAVGTLHFQDWKIFKEMDEYDNEGNDDSDNKTERIHQNQAKQDEVLFLVWAYILACLLVVLNLCILFIYTKCQHLIQLAGI